MIIISAIIRKLIEKELKKKMEKIIQPVLDLIKTLVQPQQGTKFLITVAGMGAIYMMHKAVIATTTSDIVIGVMVAVYYAADIIHKPKKKENAQ